MRVRVYGICSYQADTSLRARTLFARHKSNSMTEAPKKRLTATISRGESILTLSMDPSLSIKTIASDKQFRKKFTFTAILLSSNFYPTISSLNNDNKNNDYFRVLQISGRNSRLGIFLNRNYVFNGKQNKTSLYHK